MAPLGGEGEGSGVEANNGLPRKRRLATSRGGGGWESGAETVRESEDRGKSAGGQSELEKRHRSLL